MQTATPLFSIIVPIYNSGKYLEKALQSLRQQRFGEFEVILINDGSTDESKEICERFATMDTRFHVVSQENQGVSVARNRGLQEAKGKYLLFVDSDDTVTEDFTGVFAAAVSERRVELAVTGYYQCRMQIGERLEKTFPAGHYSMADFLHMMGKNPTHNFFGVLWNKCFLREMVEELQLRFEPGRSFGEDSAFIMDYMKAIASVEVLPGYHYFYVFDRQSSLGKGNTNFHVRAADIANVYQKYRDLWEKKGLYRKNKLRVKYCGVKYYFDEEKIWPEQEKQYLHRVLVKENGISELDVLFFRSLRMIKRLVKS